MHVEERMYQNPGGVPGLHIPPAEQPTHMIASGSTDMISLSRESSGRDVVPEDRHAWAVRVHARFQALSFLQRERLLGSQGHSLRGLYSASTEPYRPPQVSLDEVAAMLRNAQNMLSLTASTVDNSSRHLANLDTRLSALEGLFSSVYGRHGTGANRVFTFQQLGTELEIIRDQVLPAIAQRLDDLDFQIDLLQ